MVPAIFSSAVPWVRCYLHSIPKLVAFLDAGVPRRSTLRPPYSATHLDFNGGLKPEFNSKRGYLIFEVRP